MLIQGKRKRISKPATGSPRGSVEADQSRGQNSQENRPAFRGRGSSKKTSC